MQQPCFLNLLSNLLKNILNMRFMKNCLQHAAALSVVGPFKPDGVQPVPLHRRSREEHGGRQHVRSFCAADPHCSGRLCPLQRQAFSLLKTMLIKKIGRHPSDLPYPAQWM